MKQSAEIYMKTIYALKQSEEFVRAIDVAHALGFTKASVSVAMANLKKDALIIVKESGEIDFTQEGKTIAERIYERHNILSGFLQEVAQVDVDTAENDAERIEHYLSEETFAGIRR